jgi:hypothetical protein
MFGLLRFIAFLRNNLQSVRLSGRVSARATLGTLQTRPFSHPHGPKTETLKSL